MAEPLLVETRDGVATLTLNRPELRNAFDDAQIERLTRALRAAEVDGAARVVVIAGNGPAFCARITSYNVCYTKLLRAVASAKFCSRL